MLEDVRRDRHKAGIWLLPGAVMPPCEVTPESRLQGGDQVSKAGAGGFSWHRNGQSREVWGARAGQAEELATACAQGEPQPAPS